MPARLISHNWETTFLHLFEHAAEELVIVSPFIGREPVEALSKALCQRREVRLRCIFNYSASHLLSGGVDGEAVALLAKTCPRTSVFHLGGLHAKVYIADRKIALVTSANFTWSGWLRNREVGVWLDEPNLVRDAYQWVEGVQQISTPLEEEDLDRLAQISTTLQAAPPAPSFSTKQKAATEAIRGVLLEARVRAAQANQRAGGQVSPSMSENRIFASTILYLLETQGPLTTRALHPLIQALHPELCDDTVERIINGVRFGKRWKHMVRNAQQYLKRTGQIAYNPRTREWAIIRPEQTD